MDKTIKFDPADTNSMNAIMNQYGNSDHSFWGTNEKGEPTEMSVSSDKITVKTYQHNDRIRVNVYHKEGTREESYEK